MSAHTIILSLHSVLRWIVLIAGVAAAGRAIAGWIRQMEWRGLDRRLGLLFTVSMDVQVLLGLVLYLFLSPVTTGNFSNFGEAMSNPDARFFLVEHLVLMLVAVALAHVGRSRSQKAAEDKTKHARAALFFTLALVAILLAIPWGSRPLLRLGA
jgi:F0F1-type ATP synthase membrane subunit c/vacuolar-type H+-ATPase subunit K